jgi:rubredoxin
MNPNDIGDHIDVEFDAECQACDWSGVWEAEAWIPRFGDDTNTTWICPDCGELQETFVMVGDLRW